MLLVRVSVHEVKSALEDNVLRLISDQVFFIFKELHNVVEISQNGCINAIYFFLRNTVDLYLSICKNATQMKCYDTIYHVVS